MTHVAVVGGGYAGMAAATTLAAQGIRVTVFEAAKQLGGRARLVEYRSTAIDNGLHILIGAYRETLRLITLVNPNAADAICRTPLEWRIHGEFHLAAATLPAPFHLLAGFLLADGLSIRETANLLGIPEGTVKARVARARARLKQMLQQSLGATL